MKKAILTMMILAATSLPVTGAPIPSEKNSQTIADQIADEEEVEAEADLQAGKVTTSATILNIYIPRHGSDPASRQKVIRFSDPETGATCYFAGERMFCLR